MKFNPYIVCVDDEAGILELYEDFLEDYSATVITFERPDDALEYIIHNSQKILAIISDFKMEPYNGLEFRKNILEQSQNIPFFLVTGMATPELAIQAMELNISKFLDKPIEEEELKKNLDKQTKHRLENLKDDFEMVEGFVEESYPMLEEIEQIIMDLEEDPQSETLLNTYFRLLHTIKGTAACVGLTQLADFTHKYEDLVNLVKNGDLRLNGQIINSFLKGLDVIKRMFNSIMEDKNEIFNIEELVQIFDLNSDYLKTAESISDDNVQGDATDSKKQAKSDTGTKSKEEKIMVAMDKLDGFMELSGELTVIRNTILKTVGTLEQKYRGDRDVEILGESVSEMHKISSLLQNDISEMRKVSLSTVFKPLKRVIRDTSDNLGKKVNFQVSGEDLMVDSILAKVLSNSLVHMIRNGIDHGLEMPEERAENNKDETGTLQLKAESVGEDIIVEIIDDGKGLDKDKILSLAIEREVITEEEAPLLSEQKIYSLIFESGFSTKTQVTDLSGRGVGMDMVKSSIESVRGKVQITSKLGKGTHFTIVLPIPKSVLIINSLLTVVKGNCFIIPLDNIAEVIKSSEASGQIEQMEGGKILRHHGEIIPLIDLANSFKIFDDEQSWDKNNEYNIVIVKSEEFKFSMLVDQILDIEEVVVKKLSKKLETLSVFSGSSLIGDGDIALVLDIEGLARFLDMEPRKNYDDQKMNVQQNLITTNTDEIMLFTLRGKQGLYGLPLQFVERLEEFSSNLIEYTGNLPLIRYRDGQLPLVNLLEELNLSTKTLSELIADKEIIKTIVLNSRNSQFGIVVEEIKDIGRSLEGINTDISDRPGILGTLHINNETINLVDPLYIIKHFADQKMTTIEEGKKIKPESAPENRA